MGFFNRLKSRSRSPQACDDGSCDQGHCKECKWWQGQQGESVSEQRLSLGLCLHAELVRFNVELSGDSGCNRFEPAVVTAAAEVESLPVMMPGFA